MTPDLTPIAAASLPEWEDAFRLGTSSRCEAIYGITAEVPLQDWDGYEPIALSVSAFEEVWLTARRHCEQRSEEGRPFGSA